MTTIKTLAAYAATTTPPPERRQKAQLFCPVCGHESPITGDWVVEQSEESRTYHCPECQEVISTRAGSPDER